MGGGRERPKAAGWAGGLPRRAPVQGSGERQESGPLPCMGARRGKAHAASKGRTRDEQEKNILGSPLGGGRERQGRQRSDTAVGRGWALPTLTRGGPGDCPDDPPCRVAGSGNSRDRYPARGRGGATRTQRAREKHTHKAHISQVLIIGYCR